MGPVELEMLIDRIGLAAVLEMVGGICIEKAEHIIASYGGYDSTARAWVKAGNRVITYAGTDAIKTVSPR